MNTLPFELSDEARVWVHRTLYQLESADSAVDSYRADFLPPEKPLWAAWIANHLQETWSDFAGSNKVAVKSAFTLLLQATATWLRQSLSAAPQNEDEETVALHRLVAVQAATSLFLLVRKSSDLRKLEGPFLQVAFASGHEQAIQMGVDLLLQYPPDAWTTSSLALSPLMQYDSWELDSVFPKILDSQHPSILSSALDIANHVYGKRRLSIHPCASEIAKWSSLLGSLVQRLGVMEESPVKFGQSAEEIQRILFDSVSLCVSICHTLSQCNDKSCIGKLMQASELRHRRIRTEAAYALAKLGEEHGRQVLMELAADPTARTRAIAYAEELEIVDQIPENYRTSLALAESTLCQWLASVEQMGVPPSRMELLEQRTLPWPGYEAPQECFLFRFEYGLTQGEYSNVGLSGPTTKAFSHDLANVSIDDAFAMFVGWDIEHPEAYEKPIERLATSELERVTHWIDELEARAFESTAPSHFVSFFGKEAVVGFGVNEGRRLPFVFDGTELIVPTSLPDTNEALMLTYYLWRGREFFRTFE